MESLNRNGYYRPLGDRHVDKVMAIHETSKAAARTLSYEFKPSSPATLENQTETLDQLINAHETAFSAILKAYEK